MMVDRDGEGERGKKGRPSFLNSTKLASLVVKFPLYYFFWCGKIYN